MTSNLPIGLPGPSRAGAVTVSGRKAALIVAESAGNRRMNSSAVGRSPAPRRISSSIRISSARSGPGSIRRRRGVHPRSSAGVPPPSRRRTVRRHASTSAAPGGEGCSRLRGRSSVMGWALVPVASKRRSAFSLPAKE